MGANQYYRVLMADAKFDAMFTPEIELLTRCVKSKPVDLIVFDLTSPALSPTAWLEAVKRDSDLALTPVLWVGTAHPMALATTLENYRPGARIRQRPNLTILMGLVQELVGRSADGRVKGEHDVIKSSKEWKPEGEIIDDALSIFAEAELRNGRSHTTSAGVGSDVEDDFQTAEIRRSGPASQAKPQSVGQSASTPREVFAIPSSGPEEKAVLDFSEEEPEQDTQSGSVAGDQESPVAVATKAVKPPAVPASEELIDEITTKVISRLAVELFKNLDTGAIRQTVREVLAEQGR